MALVNQDLVLDVVPGPIPPILHLTEYDQNMEVVVTLMRRGQPFQIPTGTTVKIEGTLKGHPFSEDGTPSGNTVTFMVSKNMTAYSGRAWTKIKLTKDSKPVSTCGFWLDCDRAGVETEAVIGASGFEEQIYAGIAEYFRNNPSAAYSLVLTCNADVTPITFSGTYATIRSAWEAGRTVYCDIKCGNSVFRAPLMRHRNDGHDQPYYSFEYTVYQEDDGHLWFGRLTVNANNECHYGEGNIER